MTTEQSLMKLSGLVYQLDSKNSNYTPLKVGGIQELDGVKYQILKTEDNTTNGMQAMAVAPVINGKVATSEIVIAYAGTNFDDGLDVRTDIQTVIGRSKALDTSKPFKPAKTLIDGQVISAENFAKEVRSDYPNAVMTTTGHSLGEYIALYVAAENGWKNVGFNGPDPSGILSKDAKKWIKENPGMLVNYRNKKDVIGNFGGSGSGAAITIDMDMGGHVKDTLEFHALATWEFDKKGQLIIKDTFANKEALLTRAEKQMYLQLYDLSLLKQQLAASGGVLSTSEQIYLEDAGALLVVEAAAQSMQIGLDYIMKIYQEGIVRAEETWTEGLQRAQAIGTELSYHEVMSALAAGGATKAQILDEPKTYFEEKIAIAREIGQNFDLLAMDIKKSIKQLAQADLDLASQIRQGA